MGKFRPGKAGSHLAGMKLFPCNHRITFMKSLLYCRDPGKSGQNFIPAKRDHVITPLLWNYLNFKRLFSRPHKRNCLIKWFFSFKSRSAKWVKNGTFFDIFSTKNIRACAKHQKNSGLLTAFQSAIRLEAVFKTSKVKAPINI